MNIVKKLITAIMVPSLVLFSGSMLAKSEQGEKVLLCHNGNEISVSVHALGGHLRNHDDDIEGGCGPLVQICHDFGGDLGDQTIWVTEAQLLDHQGHLDDDLTGSCEVVIVA